MPRWDTRYRSDVSAVDILVEPVGRSELRDFVNRHGLLCVGVEYSTEPTR